MMRKQGIIHNLTLTLRSKNIWMRKIGSIHYFIFMWMAYTNICTSTSYEGLSRNPLEGSRERLPGDRFARNVPLGGAMYSFHGNNDLTRLLDVGACQYIPDYTISLVPPLDGASPVNTLCQAYYAMKFVLFDLQLIELKSVDPVGGSFQVEFQMILHWIDSILFMAKGTEYNDNCTFICDTNSPTPLCCDHVWVPPLRLSGCEIHEIKSSTPTPYITHGPDLSYEECLQLGNGPNCYWRRLWYLNIDATCESNMDFHNFPFDVQSLTIDILNPYASRTWFQLTKGFLQDNIDDDINNIDLSPDAKIPGWYVKELKVSSTCGTSETWKQTFFTQDILLRGLNNHSDAVGRYDTQHEDIANALSPQNLICSIMVDFNNSNSGMDFTSMTNYDELYKSVKDNYEERVNSTLEKYRQCIETNGKFFSWNMSVFDTSVYFIIPKFPSFNTSDENIKRSFNILDLERDETMSKVWFPCAISAIANLTTPGIRVSILIQRYRIFYVMKLILPTVACVAFSFAAFGLHPKDLVGRLTVVVPSAIALTALQSLVVSTDLPPVAYIAPSTYIFIFSYFAQILISFESVFVKCLNSREKRKRLERGSTMSKEGPIAAPVMHGASTGPYYSNTEGIEMCAPGMQEASSEPNAQKSNTNYRMSATRKLDLILMAFLGALYIMTIMICTLGPLHRSTRLRKDTSSGYVTLWPSSTN